MQIKSKTLMSWSSRKKNERIFCTVSFAEGIFFDICVLSQCISVLKTISEITYVYITKNITSYTFLLVLKIRRKHSLYP